MAARSSRSSVTTVRQIRGGESSDGDTTPKASQQLPGFSALARPVSPLVWGSPGPTERASSPVQPHPSNASSRNRTPATRAPPSVEMPTATASPNIEEQLRDLVTADSYRNAGVSRQPTVIGPAIANAQSSSARRSSLQGLGESEPLGPVEMGPACANRTSPWGPVGRPRSNALHTRPSTNRSGFGPIGTGQPTPQSADPSSQRSNAPDGPCYRQAS